MTLNWTSISASNLSKELEIKKQGQVDGSNGIPQTEQIELTPIENQILGRFQQNYSQQTAKSIKESEAIENLLENYAEEFREDGHDQFVADIKRNWSLKVSAFKSKIKRRKDDLDTAVVKLSTFRQENEIVASREPKKRTTLKLIFSILLPLFLGVIEITTNMGFLAENLGVSEAIALAVMVSVVNIGLSFLVAKMCLTHYINPVSFSFSRRVNFIFLLFFFFLLIYVNSMIGVFRGLVEIANETGQRELLQAALTNSVWPFNDFSTAITVQSVFLMIVGFFFAFTALLDGYYFNDPISGYGALGKIKYDLEKKIKNMKEEQLDKLIKSYQADSFKELTKKRGKRDKAVTKYGKEINRLQRNNLRFNNNFNLQTENSIDSLIDLYRSNNKRFRGDIEAPEYFRRKVDKSFIQEFKVIHENIAEHVMGDPERRENEEKFKKIIKKEFNAAHAQLTSYFKQEESDLRSYV